MCLRVSRLLFVLLAIDAVLVLGYLITRSSDAVPGVFRLLFDLSGEGNFATWFSSTQLAAVAFAAGIRAGQLRRNQPHWRIYALAALGFLFLSMDEGAMIHERLSFVAKKHGLMQGTYIGEQSDLIVAIGYLVAGAVLLVAVRRSIRPFLADGRGFAMIVAGCVSLFVGAAIIDNIVAYPYLTTVGQAALEDGMELAGGSLILSGFVLRLTGTVTIQVSPDASREHAPSDLLAPHSGVKKVMAH